MGQGSFPNWLRNLFAPRSTSKSAATPTPQKAVRGYARTARDVTTDSSYAHVWTSPGSDIAYHVKAVLTPELLAMTDPPFHRRILLENEPESYVYVGILDGKLVETFPQSDMPALGLRVSLGTGLPFIHNKPRPL